MSERTIYAFSDDLGGKDPRELLGGKGAGLAEMTRLGIPVPPGFTIATPASRLYHAAGAIPDGLWEECIAALGNLERAMDRRLGDPQKPLLVSVRSGAAVSMPGMMDTVLNLGLNEETVMGLAAQSGDERFALDAYRRFIEMFADVVLGVGREAFDRAFREQKQAANATDQTLPPAELRMVIGRFFDIVREAGQEFPLDAKAQLREAIGAVFRSWNNPRAIRYRRMQGISDDFGTAVNIQAMVFGNLGEDSGSGVAFTRNPSTGDKSLYGEFLTNAQGEDVVAGIRNPRPLTARGAAPGKEAESMERAMPEAFEDIQRIGAQLEGHFRDLQDIEFTIERNKVYILQTRSGKRTGKAALKIAVDMVDEGVVNQQDAVLMVDPTSLEQLLHAQLPAPEVLEERGVRPVAAGLPASPGAAVGRIVLDADEAVDRANAGEVVVLVRRETSPEDIHGMRAAAGVITATGGMTSHAAVVARGLGKCCVAGCSAIDVDYEAETVSIRTDVGEVVVLTRGDTLTIDGSRGLVYSGEVEVVAAATVPEFETLMEWADAERRMGIRTNADTPRAVRTARSYGAEGVGLCRTEHMFFSDERLSAVRCMVLAPNAEAREEWLAKLEPMQRGDFQKIFEAMDGLPVTIRLLDWPLHEFLPKEPSEVREVAEALGEPVEAVDARARAMHEINPMLGHRGVRLGLTLPEVYEMQVRAIGEAAAEAQRAGRTVNLEIMIPVVAMASELGAMAAVVRATMDQVLSAHEATLNYLIGTMIELPRACLTADALAASAEFFSFGTNDLTQTTFGVSRDDAGRFLPAYLADPRGLLTVDPFVRLDESGVGRLIELAVEGGRRTRPELKLGICGEHGGDPGSIDFAERAGLDYVSCSPPRLPVARLAAAQAAVRKRREE